MLFKTQFNLTLRKIALFTVPIFISAGITLSSNRIVAQTSVPVYAVADNPESGDTITYTFSVGDAPIMDVERIQLQISYDSLILLESLQLSSPWFNPDGLVAPILENDPKNKICTLTLERPDPQCGFGEIAKISFIGGIGIQDNIDIRGIPLEAVVFYGDSSTPTALNVFPVPAYGHLFIESEKDLEVVQIVGATGKVVLLDRPRGGKIKLDLTNLPSGVYWIRFRYANTPNFQYQKILVRD